MVSQPNESRALWSSAIPKLSGWQIIKLLKAHGADDLPLDIKVTLLKKALGDNLRVALFHLEGIIGKLALEWGKWEPKSAATWALALPDQRVSKNAIQIVYTEWRKYDETEAKEWGRSLPLDYRKKIDLD